MALFRWRNRTLILVALSLSLLFLAACESGTQKAQSSPTPTPSPTLTQGQQLLAEANSMLTSAKTLQGILNLKISGQTLNGTLNTNVWSIAPDKNRTEVRQSTLSQSPVGSVTVTDGKTVWQYNPAKNIVYSGPAQSNGSTSLFGLAG